MRDAALLAYAVHLGILGLSGLYLIGWALYDMVRHGR